MTAGIDYSKLSDAELEAITSNDYSKLSDSLLQQISEANRANQQAAAQAAERPADPPGFNRDAARQAGYTDEEIDAYLRNPQAHTPQAETLGQEARGLAQILAVPAAAAVNYALENPVTTAAGLYGAYKGSQLANAAIDRLRAPPAGAMPPAGQPGSPSNPIGSSSGAAPRQIPINVQPPAPATSPILDAQGRPMVRPAPVAPVATAPAAPGPVVPPGGPAPVSAAPSGGVINRATDIVKQLALQKVAPALGAAARIAGPVGLGYSIYEASPYIQQGGQELASGAAQNRMREAQRSVLNAPTPAPLTRQEAQNLIASGDQRLIGIYRNDPEVARLLSGQ